MNTNLPFAVIRSLGISGTHLGYYYLNTCLMLILEDENRLLMVSKLLYPLVAEIHSTTPSCVERNIPYRYLHLLEPRRQGTPF